MVKSPRARGKKTTLPRPQRNADSSATSSSNVVPPTTAQSSSSTPSSSRSAQSEALSAASQRFLHVPTLAAQRAGISEQPSQSSSSGDVTARENPNLTIATPGSGGSRRRELVFYTNGERAPPEVARGFPQEYIDLIFSSMYKFCPTLVPTTYEAAAEYLREEKMKPKGKRDLRREFCYLSFTKIEESVGKPTLFLLETQTLIAVAPGHSLAVPTIDCPPWAFDRERNTDPTIVLFDPGSRKPLDAAAIMTYFTNTDPNQRHAFNEEETNIIQYKGKMYE